MTDVQKKVIRDNAQAIRDLAYYRLGESGVVDENVRSDLAQIVGLADAVLLTVGDPYSTEPVASQSVEK